METKLISVAVPMAVRENFKRQIMEKGAREKRFLTISQAVREALISAGFDISEEPKPATNQQPTSPA